MNMHAKDSKHITGEFVTLAGERFYAIHNTDQMAPFFVSVVSDGDHWMFVSSTGGLTAGRVSPETALFPYVTVDKIHESAGHTGSKTLIRATVGGKKSEWEPFNVEHDGLYHVQRHIYKNVLGNKICFEEINHDLSLAFRYTWVTSEEFGFARQCELLNLSDESIAIDILDGLQNILPAGTPRFTQTNSSNLVDAYKWTELDESSGVAFFTLYSGITDRAEPCESLKANTVFCLGMDDAKVLLSAEQIEAFRLGTPIHEESSKRGIRGAYLLQSTFTLAAQQDKQWQLIANVEQTQNQVVSLIHQLSDPDKLAQKIETSVAKGSDALARIMAAGDGFQTTNEENVAVHHYANVLFNILRGGVFDNQYQVWSADFSATIQMFNKAVFARNKAFLEALPEQIDIIELLTRVKQQQDAQLDRLAMEYLPITFGRRHGDPSRPWNQFAIRLKDENGNRLLTYQGNWRDIFQNWEALTFSYPEFVESVIAKFVNASTMDGYNPYRITKEGIDWEVEEPDDPWSYIGYWGDHQIIYLLKMLELSKQFHPDKLSDMLHQEQFCYANVPYRIKPYADMLVNAKSTVVYDEALAQRIEHRLTEIGADGKLVLDAHGDVYQVNLLEKLIVPLLCKLGNLVVDGGIWLNAQRPEWNDANNALVGQGLSMVTLYYLRRYIRFMQELLVDGQSQLSLSTEVNEWLVETAKALQILSTQLGDGPVSAEVRQEALNALGQVAGNYRAKVYQQEGFSGKTEQSVAVVKALLDDALQAIDHSIDNNLAKDGLYHAYNLLDLQDSQVEVKHLYPMLEGQVAALSSGAIAPRDAISVLESLFASDVYRADQKTFMLYPDRKQVGFLAKNRIPEQALLAIPLAAAMLAKDDRRIVSTDLNGDYRFNADLSNAGDLQNRLAKVTQDYPQEVDNSSQLLINLYEQVFNHQAFTGRSGGMFGFEGLGCIYWHMVAKLLLAVKENFFTAVESNDNEETIHHLGQLYYRVREGIGFNKTPEEYGAFPTDPYSHTPKHAGAQQPGMTGQVKEEILTRFGELGVRVHNGSVSFKPRLLRACEFLTEPVTFKYLAVDNQWQQIPVGKDSLAFSWCQLPIVYHLDSAQPESLQITWQDGKVERFDSLKIDAQTSAEIFKRTGKIKRLDVSFSAQQLLA